MQQVDPSIYNTFYYEKVCLGSNEFNKTGGKKLHARVTNLLSRINVSSDMRILDLGCGRGDITLNLAKKAKEVVGIDYSKDAITLANRAKKNFSKAVQKKTHFYIMNAKKMTFTSSSFDIVVCIDVFEHLYRDELEVMLREIKRVLKPDGLLYVHTGTNKLLYDMTYPMYIRPVNKIITWLDMKLKHIHYAPLPNDPRTREEKEQHVNEPTYGYLARLFHTYHFEGSIEIEVGYIKPVRSRKTQLYNFLVTLYPLSKYYPLNRLFGWVFICTMRNKK